MSDEGVPVFIDQMSLRFVLKDGTPISNLRLTNVESRMDTSPIYEMGSSSPVAHATTPPRITIRADFVPDGGKPIDAKAVNRRVAEIKAKFAK